ncbi:MAG: hypothetical protein C0391_00055 [Anaerolinea sp.]|nr:hypothetical protein [Anaerolinea sp.]
MYQNIRSDSIAFRDSFISEISLTSVDNDYGAVIRILLFYIWRGCSLSRKAGISGKADPQASLISLSGYEALLAIIQLIRIGYQADAITLLRSLMERIAIIGYLGENRELIPRYFSGKLSPFSEATRWAKQKPISNWMILYSTFSKVVHSKIEGPAGHIHNRNTIGNAFRLKDEMDSAKDADMTEELICGAIYSLMALDPLALILLQDNNTKPYPNDPDIIHNIGHEDLNKTYDFLKSFIERYEKPSK